MMQFRSECLHGKGKSVPLHRVFHSIRFKVNKGWSTAVLLFFARNPSQPKYTKSGIVAKSIYVLWRVYLSEALIYCVTPIPSLRCA